MHDEYLSKRRFRQDVYALEIKFMHAENVKYSYATISETKMIIIYF